MLDALQSENARSAAFLPANDDERGERGLDVPVEESGFARSDARIMLGAGPAAARRARAPDPAPALRRGAHAEPDRGPARDLPDARVPAAAPGLETLRQTVGDIDELTRGAGPRALAELEEQVLALLVRSTRTSSASRLITSPVPGRVAAARIRSAPSSTSGPTRSSSAGPSAWIVIRTRPSRTAPREFAAIVSPSSTRVVEPVDRQVRAGRQHRDHPSENGPGERAAGDGQLRLVGRRAHRPFPSPRSSSSPKLMITSVPFSGAAAAELDGARAARRSAAGPGRGPGSRCSARSPGRSRGR